MHELLMKVTGMRLKVIFRPKSLYCGLWEIELAPSPLQPITLNCSNRLYILNELNHNYVLLRLLITYANSLDIDQDHQNVDPDLNPNRLTLW